MLKAGGLDQARAAALFIIDHEYDEAESYVQWRSRPGEFRPEMIMTAFDYSETDEPADYDAAELLKGWR